MTHRLFGIFPYTDFFLYCLVKKSIKVLKIYEMKPIVTILLIFRR